MISLPSPQGRWSQLVQDFWGQHPLRQTRWEAPLWFRGGGEESLGLTESLWETQVSAPGPTSRQQVVRTATSYLHAENIF